MEPEDEETDAKLTPAQIMEFFEACDTLLALPGLPTYDPASRTMKRFGICGLFQSRGRGTGRRDDRF